MIRLDGVSRVFGEGPSRVPALTDITFGVDKGEFVVLTGASGAGKTTLLRLLYRDERPTEGQIEVAGFDLSAMRRRDVPRLRRSIGVVFQDAKLLAGRTVFENVAFVLRVLGTPRREITPRAFAALKAVGLSARAQADPHQLSQGEAQRASLPRAIVKSPARLVGPRPAPPPPALPARGAARLARPRDREVPRAADRRRADGQSRRRHGGGDPRDRQGFLEPRHDCPLRDASVEARRAPQAAHAPPRARAPRQGRGVGPHRRAGEMLSFLLNEAFRDL